MCTSVSVDVILDVSVSACVSAGVGVSAKTTIS